MCFDTCDTNFYVKGYSCIMYFDTCDTNFYNGLQSRQSTSIRQMFFSVVNFIQRA